MRLRTDKAVSIARAPESRALQAPPLNASRVKSWSDEELVAECLKGDQEAWSALVDRYKNLVYSVPMKYRMSAEDAADIFQAVWADLYAELRRLRRVDAIRGWLVATAGHKCYHWKRRQQKQPGAAATDSEQDPIDPGKSFLTIRLETEREQRLRDAMEKLPERCQRMVRLLFFEQPPAPYEQVAEQLGLAVGSIGFIRGRCLQKLRGILEEMDF
jgi:RNA polymerase sigma factor (sigma-70 family)